MHSRILRTLVVLVSVGMLTACNVTHTPDSAPESVPKPAATQTAGDLDATRVAFVVRTDDTEIQLAPWEWQLNDDGGSQQVDPPDVGSPDRVFVFVPIGEWSFGPATMYSGEAMFSCDGFTVDADIEDLGEGWFALSPRGPAADYTVQFTAASGPTSGMSPRTGGMTGSIAWTTTDAQADELPPVEASMSLVTDESGTLKAGDLMIELANLGPVAGDVDAIVTVTAAGGQSESFRPEPTELCIDGSFNLVVPWTETQGVLDLGAPPFTYDVAVTVDGETFAGTAEYTTGPGFVPIALEPPQPSGR